MREMISMTGVMFAVAMAAFIGTIVALFVFYSCIMNNVLANEVSGYVDIFKADDVPTRMEERTDDPQAQVQEK